MQFMKEGIPQMGSYHQEGPANCTTSSGSSCQPGRSCQAITIPMFVCFFSSERGDNHKGYRALDKSLREI